jgi:hypothetical protein
LNYNIFGLSKNLSTSDAFQVITYFLLAVIFVGTVGYLLNTLELAFVGIMIFCGVALFYCILFIKQSHSYPSIEDEKK